MGGSYRKLGLGFRREEFGKDKLKGGERSWVLERRNYKEREIYPPLFGENMEVKREIEDK